MQPEEAAKRVSAIPAGDGSFRTIPPEAFPEQVQIISRDEAGYALQLQIGGFPFNGEEVRLALGLPSACFELNRHGSDVRFTGQGKGAWLGLKPDGGSGSGRGWMERRGNFGIFLYRHFIFF